MIINRIFLAFGILLIIELAMITLARAECIPSRIEGPAPGTKVGGEYGQLPTLQDKQVILTFDDGPHPQNTPIIQDILKSNCISAVFFLVGQVAEPNAKLVQLIVANGHTVGSHSWDHAQPFKAYNNDTTALEISKGAQAIKDITPEAKPYFRYPGLGHNAFTERYTTEHGITVWSGDIDPRDWSEPGTQAIIQRILSQLKIQHRGIIILHENHASTVKALPVIIKSLRDNGYVIVGVK